MFCDFRNSLKKEKPFTNKSDQNPRWPPILLSKITRYVMAVHLGFKTQCTSVEWLYANSAFWKTSWKVNCTYNAYDTLATYIQI